MATRTKDELITVREAARQCGRNPETIRRWVWSGKLPAEKLGNQLFIKRSALDGYCRLPARSVPAKAGETVVQEYKAETAEALHKRDALLDFLKKAKAIRNEIHARTGEVFDAEAMIRELRDERQHELA